MLRPTSIQNFRKNQNFILIIGGGLNTLLRRHRQYRHNTGTSRHRHIQSNTQRCLLRPRYFIQHHITLQTTEIPKDGHIVYQPPLKIRTCRSDQSLPSIQETKLQERERLWYRRETSLQNWRQKPKQPHYIILSIRLLLPQTRTRTRNQFE